MSERVLVIGGSSNLGLSVAHRLSLSGYAVTIAGRNEARLKTATQSLGDVSDAVLDVTDSETVARYFSSSEHQNESLTARTESPSPTTSS